MPFQSEAQRRFMWAKHPAIAKRWTEEEKSGHYKKKKSKEYAKEQIAMARSLIK